MLLKKKIKKHKENIIEALKRYPKHNNVNIVMSTIKFEISNFPVDQKSFCDHVKLCLQGNDIHRALRVASYLETEYYRNWVVKLVSGFLYPFVWIKKWKDK